MDWSQVVSEATAARLRVGAELRRLRKAADLSGEQVAAELGWSQPKVSRVEAGRVAHALGDVAALLALYGAGDDLRAELLATVAEETGEGAWIVRAGGSPRRQVSLATMEATASRMRQYHPQLVPGLVQTREYAETIARLAGVPDPRGVADVRMQRQEAAYRDKRLRLDIVLDARALAVDLGDAEVLAGQARHLAGLGAQPRLTVRVIPVGAVLAALSPVPFAIYDFQTGGSAPVIYVETPTADLFVSAAADVDRYVSILRRLARSALSAADSSRYLRRVADAVDAGKWPFRVEGSKQ